VEIVKPKKLKIGDTIGIIAPSGFGDAADIDAAALALKNYGFQVKIHPQCYERDFVTAGSVEQRVKGLHDFFKDDSVNAIFAMRGGLRSMQLLDHLDYDLIEKHPKIFIGYSDATFLLSTLNKRCNMPVFHGLTLSRYLSDKPKDDQEKTLSFLQGGNLPWPNAGEVSRSGEAEGIIYGGNFSLLISLLAAKETYRPILKNRILLIEDIGEEIRQIDRMMGTLALADVFDDINALVVGQMSDIRDTGDYYKFNRSAQEIILEYLKGWDKPVVFNAPFGHAAPNLPFPIGIKARLTAPENAQPQLQLLESPFSDA
jgi:muramoyltetrapeptide carboxypeptidase